MIITSQLICVLVLHLRLQKIMRHLDCPIKIIGLNKFLSGKMAFLSNRLIRKLKKGFIFNDFLPVISHFGPRVYPMGSMVIAIVSPLVGWSVFRYLGDCSLVFKRIGILKKNLILGLRGIKCQKLGFLDIFSATAP